MITPQPKYDIEQGPLAETYGLFVPETINTGAELSADRITEPTLRDTWFYTANLPLATKREGKLLLGMGGRTAFNAVFGIDTARVCDELRDTGYIHLSPEQRDVMLQFERAGEVTFVNPKDLRLKGQDAEYRQFPIRTGAYGKDVTLARMPFVHAGYGSGDQLRQVMGNLKEEGLISETVVFTMSPDHAAENVQDDQMVARASRLVGFVDFSGFDACGRSVDFHDALRGVRRVVAEGDAAPKSDVHALESIVGKGTDVGNGLVVVQKDQLSDEVYAALTRKR